MPHTARKISASGYYHVVSKGLANQILFDNDDHRRLYLSYLRDAKVENHLRLHAYCLMSNHVHLIVEDEHEKIADAMKYVDERYAMYYAQETGRTGGLFRKPYWSEPIEDDARLLCAVRYVHNNPAAAGLCRASQYEWSSVKDYLGTRRGGITDTSTVLDMLGGVRGFILFSRSDSATALPFADSKLRNHLDDTEVLRLATDIIGHDPRTNSTKDEIRVLKERGFPHLQIARITGWSKSQIARA